MARNIPEERRLYRGTTAQHAAYTGPQGEVTVDTSKNTVVVQDGSTAGGHALAKDSEVVHNTGTETVAGTKTFTSSPIVVSSAPNITLQQTDIVKGTAPDESNYAAIKFVDSEGTAIVNRMSLFEAGYRASSVSVIPGASYTVMAAYEPVHGSESYSAIFLYYPVDGSPYATAPTPSDVNDSSIKIATTAWVDAMLAATGTRYASSVGYNNIASPDEDDNELKTYQFQVVDFNNYHTAGEYHVRWYYGDSATTDADGNVVYPTLNAPVIEDSSSVWWDGLLTVRVASTCTSVSTRRRWVYDLVVLRYGDVVGQGLRFIRTGWQSASIASPYVPTDFTPWYLVGTTEVEYGNSAYAEEVAAATASVAALSLDEEEDDSTSVTSEAITSADASSDITPADIIANALKDSIFTDESDD